MNHLQQELFSQLGMVDQRITESESHIVLQRDRVEAIKRASGDASISLALLQTFEESLILPFENRKRVLRELEAALHYRQG